jgi:hypothetical protein
MSLENPKIDKISKKELKAVVMPGREEMLQKLQKAELLGVSEQTDRFYQRFVESVAGSSKVGPGLNLAWELAAYDTLRAYPAVLKSLVDMNFNHTIEAVTPDPEVAAQAIEMRNEMMAKLRKQVEKEKQPAVEDPSSNFELYVATRRIGDIVLKAAHRIKTTDKYFSAEDRRNEGVNPYYNQTETGLYLDFSYRSPHKVWTPWGEWGFVGSVGSGGDDLKRWSEDVLGRLETKLFRPEINNEQGSFGPTYAVHKIGDNQLPEPKIRPNNSYLPYKTANKIWEDYTSQYQELKLQKGKNDRS